MQIQDAFFFLLSFPPITFKRKLVSVSTARQYFFNLIAAMKQRHINHLTRRLLSPDFFSSGQERSLNSEEKKDRERRIQYGHSPTNKVVA